MSEDEVISSEVQQLIIGRPHWIIRKGNAIFALVLLFLLTFAWVIKYPDVVRGSIRLVAINAPKLLVAKTEGKLQKLLVGNEQEVTAGQPLAFLQSTADHRQILALQDLVGRLKPFILRDSLEVLLTIPLPAFDQLGEVQPAYQEFQNTLNETLQVLSHGYYQQKKLALQKDLYYLSALQASTQKQRQLIEQDYALQQTEYTANESLARDRVIAPLELNQTRSKVIGKEQTLEQLSAQLINNSIATLNKEKEILELKKYVSDQQQKFRGALLLLKSKVEEWIQQYVILAPEDGKVLFASFLQENQLLTGGQELFYLQPPQSRYYGQMLASQAGLGKIRTGQRVLIRMESFPSNEFGYLTGVVGYISNIPTARDSFLIKVDLPRGLNTSYNKTILFRNNLDARAEVMTDDRRLFDRFLGQLGDVMRR